MVDPPEESPFSKLANLPNGLPFPCSMEAERVVLEESTFMIERGSFIWGSGAGGRTGGKLIFGYSPNTQTNTQMLCLGTGSHDFLIVKVSPNWSERWRHIGGDL